MIGDDEYIIKIGNKTIRSKLLNPIAKKVFWHSIKKDTKWLDKFVEIVLIRK